MKATELMIGDWIKIFDFIHPRQVDIIDMHSIRVSEYHYPNCNTRTATHNCPESEITPIFLTQEILKKNGFEIKEILHQYRWSIFYNNMLILSKVKFDYEIQINNFSYKIRYIHELQHALRLCGLDELADNFKI